MFDKILELWNAGESLEDIAKALNKPSQYVKQTLHSLGMSADDKPFAINSVAYRKFCKDWIAACNRIKKCNKK